MTDEPQDPNDGRIKLVKPNIKLTKPASSGSGLKIVGLVIAAAALLLWLFSGSGSNESPAVSGSTQLTGQGAADLAVAITKQLGEASKPGAESAPQMDSGASPSALNGVRFTVAMPTGWATETAGRQIFLRKPGDPRVCQITANPGFDLAGFREEALGKEIEFESQTMKEIFEAVGQGQVKVNVTGKLLDSSNSGDTYRYAVQTRSTTSANARSTTQSGVNATSIAGTSMVRLQCMNMEGDHDKGSDMETIGRSLSVTKS